MPPSPESDTRRRMRDFLARYRHPNVINGEDWTEADVERLARVAECVHRPDPSARRRCQRCGATVGEA